MPSLFSRFGSKGRHRQVDPEDQIEILKMELDYVRRIAAGRKRLITQLGQNNKALQQTELIQASRIRELVSANDQLIIANRQLASRLELPAAPVADPSATTQEIRLAKAEPIAVDMADHLAPGVNARDLMRFGLSATSAPVQPVLPRQRPESDGCDR